MTHNFEPDVIKMTSSIIKVIGVGGGGCNAVNYMYKQGIEGVEFFVCNTDAQALLKSPVPNKVQLGLQLTEGLGAGSKPEEGRKAAMENVSQINDILRHNTKMVFVTAGMGGGTGTGAAPIIAKIAREQGILTVGIVTIPFEDEGPERNAQAQEGIDNLRPHVDALLTICNDRIVDMYGDLPVSAAFSKADDILCTAAKGIAEIITKPGKLNVDFKDVETAMYSSGRAIMGTGIASGENRAEMAVQMALDSPLLGNTRIRGAKHLLVNFTYGSKEPLMSETSKVKRFLQEESGHTAHLKMGITYDETLGEEISITVIATGFENQENVKNPTMGQPAEIVNVVETTAPTSVPAIGKNPEILQENDILSNTDKVIEEIMKATANEGRRMEREKKLQDLNEMNIPAYLRRNINLIKAPDSESDAVSKITISETTEEQDFTIKKNPHLHDNAD